MADPGFISGFKFMAAISKYEKVVLTGDGSDELYGGYGLAEKILDMQNIYLKNYKKRTRGGKNLKTESIMYLHSKLSMKTYLNLRNQSKIYLNRAIEESADIQDYKCNILMPNYYLEMRLYVYAEWC